MSVPVFKRVKTKVTPTTLANSHSVSSQDQIGEKFKQTSLLTLRWNLFFKWEYSITKMAHIRNV